MAAKFYANPRRPHTFTNCAVGYYSRINACPLGPFAKVHYVPLVGTYTPEGTPLELTCYATGYPKEGVIPACTKHRGKHIGGVMSTDIMGNISFTPKPEYLPFLPTQG